MKKLVALFAFLFSILSMSAFEYRIITNSNDSTLNGYDCILYNSSDAITEYIGTIESGQINITGQSSRSFPGYIMVQSEEQEMPKKIQINLIVEPGTITLDWNEALPVSNGKLNEEMKNYIAKLEEFQSDPVFLNQFRKIVFKNNFNNGFGEMVLLHIGNYCSPDDWAEAISLLDEETKELEGIRKITSRMERIKPTWEGQLFTDLKGRTLDGVDVSLSDYVGKGKYVIADIWTSWCRGCIGQAKEVLVPLYNEFKDNPDVEFIGIALDDIREAVKKHGIPWIQITECDKVMAKYCIYSLPEIIMFAPDGTILHRHLRCSEIANKLKSVLK